MLPEFELLLPETLAEALHLLAEHGQDVLPLAGGTNLIPNMQIGKHAPHTLMNIAGLQELRGIRQQDGYLVLGGGVTIAEVLGSPLVRHHAPLLERAAIAMANPLVRNRATLGGNLVNASPAADMVPPLLALDAEVELVSEQRSRFVRLEHFFLGPGKSVREPAELLASVRFLLGRSSTRWAYRKLALRKAGAVSVVSAAVTVTYEQDGHCAGARVALGAVAPTPIRAYAAEKSLHGCALTPTAIARAADLAVEATRCIDDIRGHGSYRQRVTGVLVRRLLSEAASEAA